jgi:hypothetical protein
MFPRQSHRLSPLTLLSGKTPFIWTNAQQKAFDVLKAMMIKDCLLRYPDHNKSFQIYADASEYQLDGAPVAYYSRKLTNSPKNYTTMEKELLKASTRVSKSFVICYSVHKLTFHQSQESHILIYSESTSNLAT